MAGQDITQALQEQVQQAFVTGTPLRITGGNSKAFYGTPSSAQLALSTQHHSGIIAYEPSELVITVRAGTPLQELNALLAAQAQMLAFEPPLFTDQATIGGVVACGFSGPRRPFAGSVRDFMLGCTIINGHAQVLHFGGQVIKNVAGFDVSRLMVGALGQLGVLLDISLRVLPMPEAELTLCFEPASAAAALQLMQQWQGQPWPISALAYADRILRVRLSGSSAAITSAAAQLGGVNDDYGALFWLNLREQQLPFFQTPESLWRISIAPATVMLDVPGCWLLDWGGAQRWLKSSAPAADIHAAAQCYGGYAECFRGQDKSDWLRFEPGLLVLHQKVRQAFDPLHLFNPHCFSPEL